MTINIGIIGLGQSGKTTVFNALTGGKADTVVHGTGNLDPNIGMARVPDPRMKLLNEIFHPAKTVYSEVKYLDIGASVKSLAKDKGMGGQLLNQLSTMDTIICAVRAFKDESIPHPDGTIDVKRDAEALNLELIFSDLAIMERRLERLEGSMKAAKPGERAPFLQEKETLLKMKADMEKDMPIRAQTIDPSAQRFISNYQFLTAKPLLIIVNIGEEQLAQSAKLEEEYNKQFAGPNCRVVTLCGKLEMELAQMDAQDAEAFRKDYGLKESGLEHVIRASYELSNLITFFTVGPDEDRAWPIKNGLTAPKAAGKIHTDFEKGFIRAETIHIDELLKVGSLVEAKKKGILRLEGKEYIVKDGDVITFLFNV
jgi:GTP-binding protein YchF